MMWLMNCPYVVFWYQFCLRILSLLLAGGLLIGCAKLEPRETLPFLNAPALTGAGSAELTDRWWQAFGDPKLNERVEAALSRNFDLVTAWERIQAARATVKRVNSDRRPEVDAFAGLSRDESSTGNDRTTLAIGLSASYELDLWGAIDSRVKAESLRADATVTDYEAAAISVSALVAVTWVQLAETIQQLELVTSQVETNKKTLELLRGRFRAGQIRNVDVLRQQNLVEATREQVIILRARQALLVHQLAALEGRVPQVKPDALPSRLPELPPAPETGLASTLLQRRPDVKSSLIRLQAAAQDVATAVSEQYPRLNLSASLETAAERPADLFQDWLFSIAGQLIAPVIDGDRRKAEVDRTHAVRRQRLAEYGQTVLQAFVEVEDALSQELRQKERIESLEAQEKLAAQTITQLRLQYINGVADYLDVLQAEITQQQLQRDVLRAQLDLVLIRVSLYRALAGRFETPRSAAVKARQNLQDKNPRAAELADQDAQDQAQQGQDRQGQGPRDPGPAGPALQGDQDVPQDGQQETP